MVDVIATGPCLVNGVRAANEGDIVPAEHAKKYGWPHKPLPRSDDNETAPTSTPAKKTTARKRTGKKTAAKKTAAAPTTPAAATTPPDVEVPTSQ